MCRVFVPYTLSDELSTCKPFKVLYLEPFRPMWKKCGKSVYLLSITAGRIVKIVALQYNYSRIDN